METKIYNTQGKEAGSIALPEAVFGLPWNGDLVHQVVTSLETAKRTPVAHTKNRGEVRGGGKKPWQQKGTGQARHGSIRSPIWVKGGVAHGPRNEKNFERKVNRKMKMKALFTILSKKYKEGEILFVDSLTLSAPKTKDARAVIESLSSIKGFSSLSTKRKNAAYIALDAHSTPIQKSFRNMGNVMVDEARNMNPVDVLNYKYMILLNPKETLAAVIAKLEK